MFTRHSKTVKKVGVWLVLLLGAATQEHLIAADRLPFRVREGFAVERLYKVPRETEGSWVSLAVDAQGRLVASDQAGSLYRIDPQADGELAAERIDLPIGHAHGLLWAFDSLYAVVATDEHEGPGLYRLQDTDDDDHLDRVTLLQPFDGTGEHGPHSVTLSPDGQSLFVVCGNKTKVPDSALTNSIVPKHWGEDDLLPRIWGPIGSEAGTPAPGGWIASTDPGGQEWTLHAIGLRNAFDIAFNQHGHLFTVDADAEFDFGTPWYQPTRVLQIVDGTDYGWRSGSGKWPPHFPDTLPPVVELGPGSPTGVTFGYKTRFPARYRDCLFVGDWSHGRLLAVRLTPNGSHYQGVVEEIVSGTPLPVTDMVVHPDDGAIYFTVGGRGTASGLFRLRWMGEIMNDEIEAPERVSLQPTESEVSRPLDQVWNDLGNGDRTIRHRARVVLELVPAAQWQEKALEEKHPTTQLMALLALARAGDDSIRPPLIDRLITMNWEALSNTDRQTLLRCMELTFARWGDRDDVASTHASLYERARHFLTPWFPNQNRLLNEQLCRLLVYLDAPEVPKKALQLIDAAATPQQKLGLFISIRHQRTGWTRQLQRRFFSELAEASSWRGGLSLSKYVDQISQDALSNASDDQRDQLAQLLRPTIDDTQAARIERPFVRDWNLEDLSTSIRAVVADGDAAAGRRLFAETQCFACHRFRDEGGAIGPDLTAVARRLNTRDLLEAIVAPDRVISDQFAASTILTEDGQVITGRVVNLAGGALLIQSDMLNPSKLQRVPEESIDEIRPSKSSMMPSGLLNSLTRQEIVDLISFLAQPSQTNE